MNYYLFLDETGDHGLSFIDKNFPLFLLAGCLFEEKSLKKLEGEINNFKKEFFGTTKIILHSREIRKCEGPFQILFDLKIKERFYKKLNKILIESDFILIGSGINKEEHIKKYGRGARDPYIISLSFILERLIFCLDKKERDSTSNIKIENRGKKEDQQLLNQYNRLLDVGTFYVSSERLKEKIEDFNFCFKRDNIIGLQIADLCAYPLARHVLRSGETYPTFDVVKNKIYCDKNGKYEGYGLKIFP